MTRHVTIMAIDDAEHYSPEQRVSMPLEFSPKVPK
jgi:hypothetical protein